MQSSALRWKVLAWCVLALAFGTAVYRAKTQTIAHDEALEYEWFLDGGVSRVLLYNTANHVLFTLLAKPVVWTLGVSEFTLRSPSLAGAAIYLIAIYLLCRRLFGDSMLLFFSVAMLCLNPQILEVLSAARGYSLGLACLTAASYIFSTLVDLREFNLDDKKQRWRCAMASMFLGLSVAASLTNVVPAVCLTLAFSIVALGGWSAFKKPGDRTIRILVSNLIVPGVFIGCAVLWPFLIQIRRAQLGTNMGGAADSVRDIFNGSFLYKWTDDLYSSLGAVPPSPLSWQARISDLGVYLLLPLLFGFVVYGLILASRSESGTKTEHIGQCRVFGGATLACVILIVLLHTVVKINYPYSRYCLFLVLFTTISAVLMGQEMYLRFPRAYLRVIGLVIAGVVLADYLVVLNTAYFRYQAYDVISRDLYQMIAGDARSRGLKNVRVGGTWWYEPEINFYRRRYHADWLLPYDIKDRSYFWETPNSLVPADYDYFVFLPTSDPGLTGSHVRPIFHDGPTGITVIAIEKP